jgi:hypothetical protein
LTSPCQAAFGNAASVPARHDEAKPVFGSVSATPILDAPARSDRPIGHEAGAEHRLSIRTLLVIRPGRQDGEARRSAFRLANQRVVTQI